MSGSGTKKRKPQPTSTTRRKTAKRTTAKRKPQKRKTAASTSWSGRPDGDRFEGRRLAAKRTEGRRRVRLVLGLAAVSTLAVVVIGFLNSSWFDVDEITVSGSDRSDPALIIEASGIDIGQALLEVDLEAAVADIELVPWVGTVELTRRWTGTIDITVVERGPSAVLDAGGRYALVDDHGRQLEIVSTRPDGFIPVVGIEGSGVAGEPVPEAALPVIALLDALPADVESQITTVELVESQLMLNLAIGGRANLGDGSDLGPKIQALETMVAKVDLQCLNTIDLRVPAAPTITRFSNPTETGVSGAETATDSEQNEESDSELSDC